MLLTFKNNKAYSNIAIFSGKIMDKSLGVAHFAFARTLHLIALKIAPLHLLISNNSKQTFVL